MTMHRIEDSFGDLRAADELAVGTGASIVMGVAVVLALAVLLVVGTLSATGPARAASVESVPHQMASPVPRDQSFAVLPAEDGDSSLAPVLVLALVVGMGAATHAVGRTVGRVVRDGLRPPRRTA